MIVRKLGQIFGCLVAVGCSLIPYETDASTESSIFKFVEQTFGLDYDSFFAGPSVIDPSGIPPGFTGKQNDSGLNFFNYISFKYKISSRYALDLQFRNQIVVTNGLQFRHQGQRLGVSGTLLRGKNWSVKGAINSDIPLAPFMGQIASERTLIFNPGLFASLYWEPSRSQWSVYAFMTPRVWFYSDPHSLSAQDRYSGGLMNKPQYDFHINPSINYRLNDFLSWRLGFTLEFLKNIGWSKIQRTYLPIDSGLIWKLTQTSSVYAYIMTSTPLDDSVRTYQLGTDHTPGWLQTASFNLWFYGAAF